MEPSYQEFLQDLMSKIRPYTVVFLVKGPNRNQDEAEMDQIQYDHLKYLNRLREEGALPIHGPLGGDDGNVIGIAIYNSADIEQVKRWCEGDPGFRAGRFTCEYYPFFTFPNSTLP
jgi:uncharacterized protein YciI